VEYDAVTLACEFAKVWNDVICFTISTVAADCDGCTPVVVGVTVLAVAAA